MVEATNASRQVLEAAVRKVRGRIKRDRERGASLGEENTKITLIDPILTALGWDVYEFDEVKREYKRKPKDNPVDYALFILRSPRLFIEAKDLGKDLKERKWIAQTLGYATVVGVEWCVLTNGDEYRLYNAHAAVDVEKKLFRSLRVSDPDQHDFAVETLLLLSKDKMGENLLDALWKAHFVDRQVAATLERLFDNQDKSLVSLIRRKASSLKPVEIRESLKRAEYKLTFPVVGRLSGKPPSPGPPSPRPSRVRKKKTPRLPAAQREIDTLVVPAREDGFEEVFLGENRWYAIRIGKAFIPSIKYIACYRVKPESAITHVAKVRSIEDWQGSGKYVVNFAAPAKRIGPIRLVHDGAVKAPQGLRYTTYERLTAARTLDEAF